jgi:hypothetical protein
VFLDFFLGDAPTPVEVVFSPLQSSEKLDSLANLFQGSAIGQALNRLQNQFFGAHDTGIILRPRPKLNQSFLIGGWLVFVA